MSGDNEKLLRKWSIIKQQLVALGALNKLPRESEELKKLLFEDIELKNLTAQYLYCFCYHILGVLNCDERNKLIQWPIINIRTNTKFRKAVSTMVNNFQEKYPWAHIKKLPESYFLNPHAYQPRVVDFMLRLTNLAVHVSVDNSDFLLMHSGKNVTSRAIAMMIEIVSNAVEKEEKVMRTDVLPLQDIIDSMNPVYEKCIVLRQEISDLQQQLNNLKKQCVNEKILSNGKDIEINDLREIRDKNLSELNIVNSELRKYHDLSKDLLGKIKAFKNPLNLSAKDFGCKNSAPDLSAATFEVCGDLYQLFQQITLKSFNKEEADEFYENLRAFKTIMEKHSETLHEFLCNIPLKWKA